MQKHLQKFLQKLMQKPLQICFLHYIVIRKRHATGKILSHLLYIAKCLITI